MEGARFGLRFLGQMANEDPPRPSNASASRPKEDRQITIDREMVVLPKKKKEEKPAKEGEKAKGKGKTPSLPSLPRRSRRR